jgi:hypothetical protein
MTLIAKSIPAVEGAAEALRDALKHVAAGPGHQPPAQAFAAYSGTVTRVLTELFQTVTQQQAELQALKAAARAAVAGPPQAT